MHTFHIPVLGISYTVDSPLKVAQYGISSVVSIIEDELLEKMRAYHSLKNGKEYTPITTKEADYRGKRITAYLNMMQTLVNEQISSLRDMEFDGHNKLSRYFEMLPDSAPLHAAYKAMMLLPDSAGKIQAQQALRARITPGAIDVNIMAKVDNLKYADDGTALPAEFSDASSALRGFAQSELTSSLVLSAGYNPRLYNYIEAFPDFMPDENGYLKKKIILKVSDFRSASIQGKLLAKKGVWISEFRIESGLNCGGHAFATDGFLLGPILEEFKQKKESLAAELLQICNSANERKGKPVFAAPPMQRITVQGGIGTAKEDEFLMSYYQLDGTGWGSPFLLVPEATNVDEHTLNDLATASKEDYYLSEASPLGVPFHNFSKSTSEQQRNERLFKGRPGSPCFKKYLATDTEFSVTPICTASREYQHLKLKQLKEQDMPADAYEAAVKRITEKDCLCEGLSSAVLLKDGINLSHGLSAVTICPGPNLAYFSGIHSLQDMVDHIYGRKNLLNSVYRSNMFINELTLYVDHLKKELGKCSDNLNKKQQDFFVSFRSNLQNGINYYKELLPNLKKETEQYLSRMLEELEQYQLTINTILPVPAQH